MSADPIAANARPWRDPKRYAWLLGLLIPTLPFLAWALVHATGLGVFWFYGPMLVFVVFPPLDLALGMDARNPPDSVIKWLEQDRYYRWCTYLYLPIQYAGLVFACWLWSHGHLSGIDKLGLALTVAMVSGIAINTAHELGHKRASLERWLSRVALAQSGYGHFFIEHNRGHHVRVATPEDPASARLGESFYAFLPRTVIGSLRSAWALERVAPAPPGSLRVEPAQRHPRRLGHDRRAVRRARRRLRARRAALPADPGRHRLLAARGRQLPRALRPAAPARRRRALRAHAPRAQLEQQQRRLQRAALPPAAPLRPPRQPHPPLPGAAPRRRRAAAAHRLRRHDPARRHPAALAARHGPPRARPLPAASSTAPTSSPACAAGRSSATASPHTREEPAHEPLSLPRLRLRLRRAARAPARGLPARHPVERGARRLGLPGLRSAR